MEFHMRYDADMESEKEVCTNSNIRFFDYPEVSYVGQIEEADYGRFYGFWRKAEPDQLERFSAVGYYFARDLQKKYGVPVGIIGCNWGGTPACAWMPWEAVAEGGGQAYLDEYNEAVESLNLAEYDEKFRKNPGSWRVDQLSDSINDLMMYGCPMSQIEEKLMERGLDLSQIDWSALVPGTGPKYERRPSGLYESMLQPIAPYAIRGVIWYQGETDGDCHPEIYKSLFPALIKSWRELWDEELPFLFVQIAALEQWLECVGTPYVEIREAQQYTADTVPGTGMAVITDAGMRSDLHPKKKYPVGHRLALLAENKVYGEGVLCEAPTLSGVRAEDGRLILEFENTGDGLYLAGVLPHGQKVDAGKFGGLQVFQDGVELNPEFLEAGACGNQVIVTGNVIRADVSTQVKIAKTGWYLVNLYNSEHIPARPAEVTRE